MTIRKIHEIIQPLTAWEIKMKLKTKPYAHTIKTSDGFEWGHDEKGFYAIDTKRGNIKNYDDAIAKRTQEFILDELARTENEKRHK
tara:strand:+ start:41 stop:298 length:258 start_codon:yes stop_codon:yes gene_type:complete